MAKKAAPPPVADLNALEAAAELVQPQAAKARLAIVGGAFGKDRGQEGRDDLVAGKARDLLARVPCEGDGKGHRTVE
jgi:hypothetical protein